MCCRRYKYYVSQAVLKYREQDAGSVVRVPSLDVERPVVETLIDILSTPARLCDVLRDTELDTDERRLLIAAGDKLAVSWPSLEPKKQIELIQTLIIRVTISRKELLIVFSPRGFGETLLEETVNSDMDSKTVYEVALAVNLKRCGIESKLIVSDADSTDANRNTINGLRDALAKALTWNESLLSGELASMNEIARREGVTQRYVAHLIKLAYLAPDIMQAIARGKIPADLTLGKLKKGFPLDWNQQRKALGFKPAKANCAN